MYPFPSFDHLHQDCVIKGSEGDQVTKIEDAG